MHPHDPESALARTVEVLAQGPAGILTDLDGTLAPIVADPRAVRPVTGLPAALGALAARLALVGVISGRAASDVRRILGPAANALIVVGNHGLEWLDPGAAEPVSTPELAAARDAVRAALARLGNDPGDDLGEGILVEDKGLSATVHYRAAPDPVAARDWIEAVLEAGHDGRLELRRGRMSVELRPRGVGDKGSAVATLVERHGLRGLVVAGDDVTDLDMFRVARSLRRSGRLASLAIGVGGGGEVPPQVAEAADLMLETPEAVAALFVALPAALSGG